MIMRTCLAAMDVNANVGRAQATDSRGALRFKIKVDRAGKNFTAQLRKQEKCDAWKKDIVDMVRNEVDTEMSSTDENVFI